MFSGIVEATGRVAQSVQNGESLRLAVEVPPDWVETLQPGDSVAHNGVCLTLEEISASLAWYTLGRETLTVTGWNESLTGQTLNLERSLRLGDRVHGHLVLGHVDGRAQVVRVEDLKDYKTIQLQIPEDHWVYFWKKGSVAINGVSLTVNNVQAGRIEVGLIPETLKRTNLSDLLPGDYVQYEVDNLARAVVRQQELRSELQNDKVAP